MFTQSLSGKPARWLVIAAAAIALPALAATALKTDVAKSKVTITFKQMNVPVDAQFKKFNAAISYDAAKPENSKANVDIDVTSFDLGDPMYNQEVQKKEWFNTAQFPKATFASTQIKAGAAGKLDVSGKLTIKGKSSDVSFPLTVKKEGTAQVFEGTLPIKRLTYGIGDGEWKDTSIVADDVSIKFRVVAAP
ncbi:MAG: YceI family protein [Oxalicibacterium faecigallinarum]|uniref:YceI family protein n=1 Tax=Oxalicibacterium faecigallinarum TaxID=573741 RepID=UPI002806A3CC|nr:YceI family protein [Oxalicibacterium faecigallinarum]MDQ7968956.1 YceI family protein [Oxalicibacterium faecigallinarum]